MGFIAHIVDGALAAFAGLYSLDLAWLVRMQSAAKPEMAPRTVPVRVNGSKRRR